MPPETHDLAALSTCTTCQFTEDLSNYWTAVIFYRGKNGTFKRVPQMAQAGMEGTQGGMVSKDRAYWFYNNCLTHYKGCLLHD